MKPLNLFTKDKLSRGGRKNECSACLSERRRIKYRKNNIEAILKREETLRREAVAKMCRKCKTVKPLSSFAKEKRARNGRLNECSECCNKRKRGYRKNNIEKVLKREAAWRIKNRDKENKKNREWKERNPEKVKAMRHEWEKKNPEYMKNWLKQPKRKLGNSISSSLYDALKNNKNGRHWEDVVGYALNDLMKHLEKQFQEGMTWDNYGEWHVDHKIPLSVFNYTKTEHDDFKRCWALKNLQPLWAKDNISKGAKLKKHFQPSLAFN